MKVLIGLDQVRLEEAILHPQRKYPDAGFARSAGWRDVPAIIGDADVYTRGSGRAAFRASFLRKRS